MHCLCFWDLRILLHTFQFVGCDTE